MGRQGGPDQSQILAFVPEAVHRERVPQEWEGEAPAEPRAGTEAHSPQRLSGSFALPGEYPNHAALLEPPASACLCWLTQRCESTSDHQAPQHTFGKRSRSISRPLNAGLALTRSAALLDRPNHVRLENCCAVVLREWSGGSSSARPEKWTQECSNSLKARCVRSLEEAVAGSRRRQPADQGLLIEQPRRGDRSIGLLRGSRVWIELDYGMNAELQGRSPVATSWLRAGRLRFPWAVAQGYLLSPLRGLGSLVTGALTQCRSSLNRLHRPAAILHDSCRTTLG